MKQSVKIKSGRWMLSWAEGVFAAEDDAGGRSPELAAELSVVFAASVDHSHLAAHVIARGVMLDYAPGGVVVEFSGEDLGDVPAGALM